MKLTLGDKDGAILADGESLVVGALEPATDGMALTVGGPPVGLKLDDGALEVVGALEIVGIAEGAAVMDWTPTSVMILALVIAEITPLDRSSWTVSS